MKHVLGSAKLVSEAGVTTKEGTVYPADMVVFCGGCEYQGSPPFLANLKLGEAYDFLALKLSKPRCTTYHSFVVGELHRPSLHQAGRCMSHCMGPQIWHTEGAQQCAQDLRTCTALPSSATAGA